MINLTINAHDGNLYEITGRNSQPQSSAAQIYRNDPYLTQRLIARLPVEPATWTQVLARIGYHPAGLHSYPRNAIYQVVAGAVMRGDLNLYRLPLLDSTASLRGKNDIGLCIIKGPKPHCSTHLSPEPIASPEAAQALLSELGIEPKAVVAYLNSQNLYNSYDQQNPLSEVLKRLAKSELLAYKIPLPPMSVPEKAVEYVAATGPGYDPVPLAPESLPPPKPTPPAPVKKAPPATLEEAEQRLIAAGPAVRAAKAKVPKEPLPGSSYSFEDKQAVVNSGVTERYMVRVVESDYVKDDGFIAQKRDHGATIGWMAPLTMVEHGDTDASALLNAFGTRHDPTKSYTILIIDTHQMNAITDMQTIIPTNKNLQKLLAENGQITKVKPEIAKQVLSEEFAPKYYKFAKGMNDAKVNQKDEVEMKSFAEREGFSKQETKLLLKRHQLAKDVSAWEEFTGNGMTMDTNVKDKIAYGPVELVMLDKSPKTLGELKGHNAILSLAAS